MPRLLVVSVARKPLVESSVTRNVLRYGTGGLNLDGCRIGTDWGQESSVRLGHKHKSTQVGMVDFGTKRQMHAEPHAMGRWPANLLLQHKPGCRKTGTKKVKGSAPQGRGFNWGPKANLFGHRENPVFEGYTDEDGMETVDAWDCVPGCPVHDLDEQSGVTISTLGVRNAPKEERVYGAYSGHDSPRLGHADSGGASRFFKQVKL